jgi:hypothetical protein
MLLLFTKPVTQSLTKTVEPLSQMTKTLTHIARIKSVMGYLTTC